MRLLVCGGRFYQDDDTFEFWMKRLHGPQGDVKVIIQGGATGADFMAKQWAIRNNVKCLQFDADWNKYKKAAGPLRNQQMIEHGQPEVALVMPGGTGTADMLKRLKDNGTILIFDAAKKLAYRPRSVVNFDFMDYLSNRKAE